MHRYSPEKSLLGLSLVIALLIDAQNVHVGFWEGVVGKVWGLCDRFELYAFLPMKEITEEVIQAASDLEILLVSVKIRKPGDQSVDKKIYQRIGRIEGVGTVNVIAVGSEDKGYLRSKEEIRSENRGLICFGHGQMAKRHLKKYDLYYDLSVKRFQPMDKRWAPLERLELLILLRLAMSQSYKQKGWALLRDVEEFFDRFQPKWKELTRCKSIVELIESLERFNFKGLKTDEVWVKERYL